ncbi:hypothetical protein LTR37_017100 [Vermiconidia calcicola]|uniref:Uncharacterized protein n=1 Tax=Vermiconidia calcicola TaxID=1690605 RepID=A0ACC3MKZ9_9PEZI|nr:hypothetical protein LTR37_017100 [Vermiconidia calcicola]
MSGSTNIELRKEEDINALGRRMKRTLSVSDGEEPATPRKAVETGIPDHPWRRTPGRSDASFETKSDSTPPAAKAKLESAFQTVSPKKASVRVTWADQEAPSISIKRGERNSWPMTFGRIGRNLGQKSASYFFHLPWTDRETPATTTEPTESESEDSGEEDSGSEDSEEEDSESEGSGQEDSGSEGSEEEDSGSEGSEEEDSGSEGSE